jgi:hypothetical protein
MAFIQEVNARYVLLSCGILFAALSAGLGHSVPKILMARSDTAGTDASATSHTNSIGTSSVGGTKGKVGGKSDVIAVECNNCGFSQQVKIAVEKDVKGAGSSVGQRSQPT